MKVGKLLLEYDESNADDATDLDIYWEDLKYELTELFAKKFARSDYKVYVEGKCMGWRCQNGSTICNLKKGENLVFNILPKTQCTFEVFNYGRGIAIQNWHHDSCTGHEWYYILPATKKQIKEME